MNIPHVLLIFRKPRAHEHFSIERTFEALLKAAEGVRYERWTAPAHSKGLLPRLLSLLALWRQRADVYHITGDVHFLALATPRHKTVLTVHDCHFLQRHSGWRRRILKHWWLERPVHRARTVVAVSEATRADIIRHTGCEPEKVRVIHSPVPDHFTHTPKPAPDNPPRILMIGTAPNKNIERQLEALRGIPCTLHLVGRPSREQQILLDSLGIHCEVEEALSDAAMAMAYKRCDMLLYASRCEGFGMPIVEAQAIGRPVVTASHQPMAGVAGRGACLVDAGDTADIRRGVLRVLSDPAYRQQLLREGLANSRRFGAEAAAKAYRQVYAEQMTQH